VIGGGGFPGDPVFAWIAASALAIVLLVGAGAKLAGFAVFETMLADYRLLPEAAVRPAALGVVGAELAAAATMLYAPARAAGAMTALALLVVVTVAVAVNLLRGRRDIRCGCGGPDHSQTLSWGLVARNAVLALLALLAAAPVAQRALAGVDALSIAGGTLALVGLYFAANQLLANHPRLDAMRG
jgi:hypothetical protein